VVPAAEYKVPSGPARESPSSQSSFSCNAFARPFWKETDFLKGQRIFPPIRFRSFPSERLAADSPFSWIFFLDVFETSSPLFWLSFSQE